MTDTPIFPRGIEENNAKITKGKKVAEVKRQIMSQSSDSSEAEEQIVVQLTNPKIV